MRRARKPVNSRAQGLGWNSSPGEDLLLHDAPAPWPAFIEAGEIAFFPEIPDDSLKVVVASLNAGDVLGWELLTGRVLGAFDAGTTCRSRLFIPSPAARGLGALAATAQMRVSSIM